jgi:hypothetical protein
VDRHLRRHLQQLLGVVEDDLHPGPDETVGDVLGRVGRHRQHPDDDLLLGDDRRQVGDVAHRQLADLVADDARIAVEDGDDLEPVVGEDRGGGDRLSQVPRPEEGDVVLAGGAEDLADLRDQRVDVVADAAQDVADRLVKAGVKIIFNYSEQLLQVPPEVTVHTSSPAVDLLYALYF